MNKKNAKKAYTDYKNSWYSQENIAKAGGYKNHAKIIRKYKQHQLILYIKQKLWSFRHFDLPFTIVVMILALLVKFMFIPSITYLNVLVITILATLIKRFIF